jgi:hypothetical protein
MKSMRYAKWWKVVESGGTSPGKAVEWWPPFIGPPLPPPAALATEFRTPETNRPGSINAVERELPIPQHILFRGAPR